MGLVRRTELDFEGHFTQIPNAWLRDTNLSLRAIGLLGQLLSHRDGWSVTIKSLATINGCGRDAIRSAVQELETCGYLRREQSRLDGGEFGQAVWITCSPSADYPATVEPSAVKPAHKKRQKLRNTKNQEHAHRFGEFWDLYPRKVGKAAAQRAWSALEPELIDQILDATAVLAGDPNLPPKQFIPYPATWLNRAGWEDEPYPDRNVSRETKPAAEGPGRGDWIRQLHDAGEHFACNHD